MKLLIFFTSLAIVQSYQFEKIPKSKCLNKSKNILKISIHLPPRIVFFILYDLEDIIVFKY